MKRGMLRRVGELARGTGRPKRAAEAETAAAADTKPAAALINAGIVAKDGPTLSTQLLAEARRAGLDLNALAPDELDVFASGGVAGLTRYRQSLWNDEASKRPVQPGVMA